MIDLVQSYHDLPEAARPTFSDLMGGSLAGVIDFRNATEDDYERLRDAFDAIDARAMGLYGYPKFYAHCPHCRRRGKFGATLRKQSNNSLQLVFGCFICKHYPEDNREVCREVVGILAGTVEPPLPNDDQPEEHEPLSFVIAYQYPGWEHSPPMNTCRFETPSGKKVIRDYYQGDWNMRTPRFPPLYGVQHWASLGKGVAATDLFLVEGEKDVHTLWDLGLWASTKPFGAGPWRPEYTELLRPWRRVFVIPDLDEAGLNYAAQVIQALQGAGIDAYGLCLPGPVGEGWDTTDWVRNGGTRDQLIEIAMAVVNAATERRVGTQR